jgi:hypothetical protein
MHSRAELITVHCRCLLLSSMPNCAHPLRVCGLCPLPLAGLAADTGSATDEQQGVQHEPPAELVLCVTSMPGVTAAAFR